jgi:phosphatidylglycerophosphate synthase
MINVPNIISVFRAILALYGFWLFYNSGDQLCFLFITLWVIVLDGLDGILARRLGQATPFGAKLDIFCDRLTELAYWLFFAWLGCLHIWVFWFFLIRGILVDYLTRKSDAPLGTSFLRSGRPMRAIYGTLKLLSFSALIIIPDLQIAGFNLSHLLVYVTVLICFLRALPVLFSVKQIASEQRRDKPSA